MLLRSLLCILFIVGFWLSGLGQNIDRIEFFIDNDPGFGNGTSVAFTPGSVVTQTFPVSIPANLPDGLHWLSVRARDANGKWSNVVVRPFLKEAIVVPGSLASIDRIEYFLDNDPGFGNGTSVPFTSSTTVNDLTFTAPLPANLPDGLHWLSVRARDANGKWSNVVVRPFLKEAIVVPGSLASIDRIEYFLDNDPGFGNGTSVPFTSSTTVNDLTFTAPLPANLPDGLHWLSVRARDANGKWSNVVVRPFLKEAIVVPGSLANLTRIEYFVDLDPGYGNGKAVPFTAATSVDQLQFNADLTGLSVGTHLLMIRALNALGQWSTVGIREFDITEVPPAAICASTATGAWTDASKWSCGHVPTTADEVVIRLGHVITLNVEGQLKNLQIQDNSRLEYATGGTLRMGVQ